VAFGGNDTFNVLSVKGTLDIDRYGRVDVDAANPERLYADRRLLGAEHNTGFLRRCMQGFRTVNFAEQMESTAKRRSCSRPGMAISTHSICC
jgi:hypothetical protein